ncbi:MAG: aspartyl protease family protein [Cyclobacteriaceae bacterium]
MERISMLSIPTCLQTNRKKLVGVLILFIMILSPAATVNTNDNYEYINIVYLKKKPIVKGVLNGKDAYFLLDTGSDITLLNHKVSRHYGFKAIYRHRPGQPIQGIGTDGTQMRYAFDVNLRLGSQKIKAKYRSHDISNIVESIYSHSSIRIAGIIGSDVMRNYGFKIDYKTKMVGIDVLPSKAKKHAKN